MEMESINRLTRDLREAARTLSDDEARYLVDAYYMAQENRIRADGQVRAMSETAEPNSVINWLSDQNATLELQIKGALDRYTAAHPMGEWMRSVKGIGPVIAAGMLAHIDIRKAPTVGHIWRFAGLDPSVKWEKKTKRPWNAQLKVLCWKASESFVKVSGTDDAYYGHVYKARKAYEIERNERGDNAEIAKAKLLEKKYGADTEARKHLEAGRLPPAQIHRRAARYAVKLFLSHLHHVWYEKTFGSPPPLPYPIAFGNHAHMIMPPQKAA